MILSQHSIYICLNVLHLLVCVSFSRIIFIYQPGASLHSKTICILRPAFEISEVYGTRQAKSKVQVQMGCKSVKLCRLVDIAKFFAESVP